MDFLEISSLETSNCSSLDVGRALSLAWPLKIFPSGSVSKGYLFLVCSKPDGSPFYDSCLV